MLPIMISLLTTKAVDLASMLVAMTYAVTMIFRQMPE